MFRYYLYTLWNKRGSYWLIALEIMLAALILFLVFSAGLHLWQLAKQPRGYAINNVYQIALTNSFPQNTVEHNEKVRRIMAVIRDLPGVQAVTAGSMPLYQRSSWRTGFNDTDGNAVRFSMNTFDFDGQEVLAIEPVAGRWFNQQDTVIDDTPILVNRKFVLDTFGTADVVGRRIVNSGGDQESYRIIGLLSDFKQRSELEGSEHYAILLQEEPLMQRMPFLYLLLKPTAAAPPDLMGRIYQLIIDLEPDFAPDIQTLNKVRERDFSQRLGPLRAGAIVGGFFTLLVCLGLFGIFWQSVTTRTKELGIKRALGLSSRKVISQFLIEHSLISVVALIAASLLVLHLPISGWLAYLDWPLLFLTLGLVWFVIIALTILCALYPAWQASRLSLADALHYE